MTERTRREQIALALQARDAQANPETAREPLRNSVLPVIDVPLDLPLLNVGSFRIAAQLTDHAQGAAARANPEAVASQHVVADLIKQVHRNIDDLKANLAQERQKEHGIITRSGILVNANTRCVLLRELRGEGKPTQATLRVAVLPEDFTNRELLELELVLQQQVDLKDEYRLINDLVMIQRLRNEGLTEAEIGARERLRKVGGRTPADQVKLRLRVLALMERARRLVDPPLQLTQFDNKEDKLQNWIELLEGVDELDRDQGSDAGDDHIRRWLVAFLAGVDSVHILRHAKGDWLEKKVLTQIDGASPLAALIEEESTKTPLPAAAPTPSGLEALSGGSGPSTPSVSASKKKLTGVLSALVKANRTGGGRIALGGGGDVAGNEVKDALQNAVTKALKSNAQQARDGTRLERPYGALERASTAFSEALTALDEVAADPGFAAHVDRTRAIADQARERLDLVVSRLDRVGSDAGSADPDE